MHALVTWGSKRGGTEGIARMIGEAMRREGLEVDLVPAAGVRALDGYDGVIVGGALYANRWHPAARRFVRRCTKGLRRVPVWFFSSGPLDDSADRGAIPPARQVEDLMRRVGALDHVTFGGRLTADARGFPVAAMAKDHSGDWRRPERIGAWAVEIARALPSARPRAVVADPGSSPLRLVGYGVLGWALCAAVMGLLLWASSPGTASVLHALLAPVLFGAVALRYFKTRGAREPLPTAVAFVGISVLLDAIVVAGLLGQGASMLGSVVGTWLPLALIFVATWAVGVVVTMLPAPRPAAP